MFQVGEDLPGCSVLYLGLTKLSAKNIMWKDCIKAVDKRYAIGSKFNNTILTATMPNGSILYLTGADADPEEMEKLLGQKYALVIVDEGGSWKQDQRRLVYANLEPAVADYEDTKYGQIVMTGTPVNQTKSLFYDVTEGKEPGWSVHKWNTFDNPYMADKWGRQIERLKKTHPNIEHTPLFKQMYLGEWFIDTDKLCYRFNEERDVIDELPKAIAPYFYVLGVDLGYDPDPSAFVLCAYTQHDPNLYIIDVYQKHKMIISDVAERIKHYMRRDDVAGRPIKIVIDAAAKQSVEEMRQREMLPLEAAEKTGKAGFIDIMSSDMVMGRIKVLRACSTQIVEEWASLVWDENSNKRQENPSCDNHISDSALYSWRYAYNYRAIPKKLKDPLPHTEEAIDAMWEREAKLLKKKKVTPFWKRS